MLRTLVRVLFGAALAAVSAAGQAAFLYYGATLGPEVTGATGSGSVLVTYDSSERKLFFNATWSGLSGNTTVAHIHCCVATPGVGTVGVAVTPGTLPGFPTGFKSGSYVTNATAGAVPIDLSLSASYTSGFVNNFGGGTADGAEDALLAGMMDGTAYFNIHSSAFPAGEIRGFLEPVPEPGTAALLAVGLGALLWSARRGTARN